MPSALTAYGPIDSIIKNTPKVNPIDKNNSCRDALPEDATYVSLAAVGEGGQEHLNHKRIHIKKEVNQEFDAQTAPNHTPETNLDITSMLSVAQSSEDVKTRGGKIPPRVRWPRRSSAAT